MLRLKKNSDKLFKILTIFIIIYCAFFITKYTKKSFNLNKNIHHVNASDFHYIQENKNNLKTVGKISKVKVPVDNRMYLMASNHLYKLNHKITNADSGSFFKEALLGEDLYSYSISKEKNYLCIQNKSKTICALEDIKFVF